MRRLSGQRDRSVAHYTMSVTALSGMCICSRDRHANEKPSLPIVKIAQRGAVAVHSSAVWCRQLPWQYVSRIATVGVFRRD